MQAFCPSCATKIEVEEARETVVICPGCGKQLKITPPAQPKVEKPTPRPRGPSPSTPFMRRVMAVKDVAEGPRYRGRPRVSKKASPVLIIGLVAGLLVLGGILIYVGISSSKPKPEKKQVKEEPPEQPSTVPEARVDEQDETSPVHEEKPEEKPEKPEKKPKEKPEDKKPPKPLKIKRVTPDFIYQYFVETGRGQEQWKEGLKRLKRAIKEGRPVYKQLLDLLIGNDVTVARAVNFVLIDLSGRSQGDAPRIYQSLEDRKEAMKDWEEWLKNAGKLK